MCLQKRDATKEAGQGEALKNLRVVGPDGSCSCTDDFSRRHFSFLFKTEHLMIYLVVGTLILTNIFGECVDWRDYG